MPELTLAQLRVFLAVIQHGSLTNAASELGLSQSAISHTMAELERQLNVRLLERGRFGARTTPVGERIARHARSMQALEQSIFSDARLEHNELRGHVRVASFRSVATHLLPDVVEHFRRKHPAVTFEIQTLEGLDRGIERALQDGHADIGVLSDPVTNALETFDFAKDDWVAVFPNSKAPGSARATWEDIHALPFLLCNEAGAPTVREYFRSNQQPLEQVAQVEEDSVLLSMIGHGFGVSILARLAIEPVPSNVAVCALPVPLERRFVIAISKIALESPINRAFLEFMRGEALKLSRIIQQGILKRL